MRYPRACPIWISEVTSCSARASPSMGITSDWSIFSSCTGSELRQAMFEKPMPKSSSETWAPIARSASSVACVVGPVSTECSVHSTCTRSGGTSWRRQASATIARKPGCSRLCDDTLMAMVRSIPASRQQRCCASAWSTTHGVSSWISVVDSMSGMNSPGDTLPNSGCVQRASASTPA